MISYLIVYIVSFTFIWLAIKLKEKSAYLSYWLTIASLLSLATFAGLANVDVGVDKLTYANKVFYQANTIHSFKEFVNINDGIEVGYLILNWIISLFISNIHWYYFIYTLIVCILFYYSITLFQQYLNIPFQWFLFLTTFFPLTLCLYRQSLAAALITLAVSLQVTKDYKLISIGLVGLAMLFHSSAAIGLVFLLLIYLINNGEIKYKKNISLLVIVLIFMYNATMILPSLSNMSLISAKYSDYVNGYLGVENPISIGVSSVFLIIGLFYLKEMKKSKIFSIAYFFSIINTFIYPLEQISSVIGRLGLYFKIFLALYYGFLINKSINGSKFNIKKSLVGVLIIIYIITSNNNFILGLPNQEGRGTFDIYPYKSDIIENFIGR